MVTFTHLTRDMWITVLTGAGVSAASGVPTFRGAGGLWRTHRATDLATPQAFARDPLLVWEFYDYRRQLVAGCQPNAAHTTLVDLERAFSRFTLITQNVDGLHQAAGSENVVNLHGELYGMHCTRCDYTTIDRTVPLPALPPHCPRCNALLRPSVVWFGENLPMDALSAAWQAAEHADLFLVIGTAGLVYPAAQLPEVARQHGAYVIEFNLEQTPVSAIANEVILGPADHTLPRWWAEHRPT